MKPTPPGWPRVSVSAYYEDPGAAIDWLVRAFGFEVREKIVDEHGKIVHSELTYGEGMFMIGGVGRADNPGQTWRSQMRSPRQVGGYTQSACLFVDDADAHCAHARANGAEIIQEPMTNDYGEDYWTDRSYAALDPEGHLWWFMQRIRTGKG
ncbi:MAG: VOC family protein [Polyangiaceae bacterium]